MTSPSDEPVNKETLEELTPKDDSAAQSASDNTVQQDISTPPETTSAITPVTPNPSAVSSPDAVPSPAKKRKYHTLWITLSMLALLICALLIFILPIIMSKSPHNAVIKIPKDATEKNVSDSLAKYLGHDYADKVMKVASLRKSDFSGRHGAYLIEEGTSPLRAERKLSNGAQEPLTVTINGFRTLPTLTERVARRLDFTSDELKAALNNKETLARYDLTPRQAIALFIDDSYQLYWSASPEQLITKIGDNYQKVWNKERRDKAAALGLTPAEVMILCSIVDEESNKLDEKGKIGRLYINRIKTGMPLQADPTVRFALNDFTIRRVKGNHLKVESPYNTYLYRGLPPGPIRTTSVATIDAVLNSEPSSHLYMCAKEDFSGYHNFAATYPEHLNNARRYQKALDARGIK